jgi:hypothetical protein
MGSKYVPSIKDIKANLRFHKKQLAVAKARKAPVKPRPGRQSAGPGSS